MKKLVLIFSMAILMIYIAGCGTNASYEGKWIASAKSTWDGTIEVQKLDIKKNGDNYIITASTDKYKDVGKTFDESGKTAAWEIGKPQQPVSATLSKDGKLIINPFASLTYVKDSNSILGINGENFKRETQEELEKLKKEAAESFLKRYPKMTIQ